MTKLQRLAAYGVLQSAGTILLVRASTLTEVPGRWFLPGGGVDHGEHPIDALRRELVEETGLEVSVGRQLGVLSDLRRRSSGDLVHSVRLIYELSDPTGSLRSEASGSSDLARFIAFEEARTMPLALYVRQAAALAGLDLQSVK